jgi:hypothetical protein
MRRALACALMAAAAISSAAGGQAGSDPDDLGARLSHIGARVAEFYARARTVTSKEKVRLQPLETDLRPAGPARSLVYELRIAWDPPADGGLPPEASVLRQVLTVNGRAPRPSDEPRCMDPKTVAPDALAMLLPQNRAEYEFKPAGTARTDGRASVMIDYRSVSSEAPEIIWKDDCVSVSLPGKTRGRLWVDAETDDVLRLDEHLVGLFEFATPREQTRRGGPLSMVIERADSSIRYRPVTFKDPEETLMLPRIIETTTVWRNAAANRVRMTQEFSEYRRFMTDGRIVVDTDLR